MNQRDSVDLGLGRVIKSTKLALLFRLDKPVFDEHEIWVPKSGVHDDSEVWKEDQEPGKVVVKLWFARRNGLEEEL